MLLKFIRLCLLFILIGGGYILINNPMVKEIFLGSFSKNLPFNFTEVKGLNTDKANEISRQLKSDLDKSVNETEKQILNIKISDLLSYVNKTQKIASDFKSLQDYLKKQVADFGKRK